VFERLPGERLQDQGWTRTIYGLVGAHDVQMSEPFEELTLPDQPLAHCGVADAVRARYLGDAAAGALLAPGIVHVEVFAPVGKKGCSRKFTVASDPTGAAAGTRQRHDDTPSASKRGD